MTDCSIHGRYTLLRTPTSVELRAEGMTVFMAGEELGAFLSAFSVLAGQNPELSHAAVLELLWPDLKPFATRDN